MTIEFSNPAPFLDAFVKAALERKALNLVVLDISRLTSIADAFIICSGRSNRQVAAIAEFIHFELKKQGIKPLSIEGIQTGHWVVLDYGHVIIHVFHQPVRKFYDLEGLWIDAEKIFTADMADINK
ncbi:ribosome-associated protein [Desulfosarcina sp. BuS5]|uniref:ribosome silencing factor n=1 Tax=Desulfosarcina sp. BuS5 TaxID=933262 RepID=UPI0005535E62|nr:ribosome silencing factor [Desulfosarcina sp. BuS5]WDN88983.1 ribosome-associated protein [Desulfosarcina sp. BuS5]